MRWSRVHHVLRQGRSQLEAKDLHDPRIPVLVTITRVEISVDLRYARVYISVMGDSVEKRETMDALHSAAGFLRRTLKPRLVMRHIPILSFRLDESIEEGSRMFRAIEELPET